MRCPGQQLQRPEAIAGIQRMLEIEHFRTTTTKEVAMGHPMKPTPTLADHGISHDQAAEYARLAILSGALKVLSGQLLTIR